MLGALQILRAQMPRNGSRCAGTCAPCGATDHYHEVMRTILTALLLTGSALAVPLTITPLTQDVQPGALVILTASEWTNWTASAGTLGSTQGSRIVLEAPRSPGTITVTITDPKDATRRAFAVVTVASPKTSATYRPPTFVAGRAFSAAVAQDGSTWVWGSNEVNVIPTVKEKANPLPVHLDGLTAMTGITTQDDTLTGIDTKHNAWVWGWSYAGPRVVATGVDARQASACVLTVRGADLYLSGSEQPALRGLADYDATLDNYGTSDLVVVSTGGQVHYGQGGTCPAVKPITTPELMSKAALYRGGNVLMIGRSGAGYRYDPKTALVTPLAGFHDVVSVALSGDNGFLVNAAGQVAVFTIAGLVPTIPVPVPGLNDIVALSVSDSHVLALRRDGTLFAAGSNAFGQLGNGTRTDSETFVQVVGLKVMLP